MIFLKIDHWLGGSQRSHQGLPMSWGWKNVTAAIAAMETRGERWVWKRTLSVWPSMCLNRCFSVVLELRRLTVVKPCQKGRGDKSEQGFPETALTVSTHTATSAAPLLLSHLAPSQGWPFGPVSPSLGKRMTSLTSSPIHCPESRVSPKDLCTEILLEMWSILGCSNPQYAFVTLWAPLLIKRLPCLPPSIVKDGAENILGRKTFWTPWWAHYSQYFITQESAVFKYLNI